MMFLCCGSLRFRSLPIIFDDSNSFSLEIDTHRFIFEFDASGGYGLTKIVDLRN